MRTITCSATFMDGRERFEAGERLCTVGGKGLRVVTNEQAARFVATGWAADETPTAAVPTNLAPVTLRVHNVNHKTEVSYG